MIVVEMARAFSCDGVRQSIRILLEIMRLTASSHNVSLDLQSPSSADTSSATAEWVEISMLQAGRTSPSVVNLALTSLSEGNKSSQGRDRRQERLGMPESQ